VTLLGILAALGVAIIAANVFILVACWLWERR
jgi:hypothetical protein